MATQQFEGLGAPNAGTLGGCSFGKRNAPSIPPSTCQANKPTQERGDLVDASPCRTAARAANWVATRFGLSLGLANVIAALAGLGVVDE